MSKDLDTNKQTDKKTNQCCNRLLDDAVRQRRANLAVVQEMAEISTFV
jgi:hypothetical protein